MLTKNTNFLHFLGFDAQLDSIIFYWTKLKPIETATFFRVPGKKPKFCFPKNFDIMKAITSTYILLRCSKTCILSLKKTFSKTCNLDIYGLFNNHSKSFFWNKYLVNPITVRWQKSFWYFWSCFSFNLSNISSPIFSNKL